jgi:hypothetical protein
LPEYDVLIRSRRTNSLHGIGTHPFAQPLTEGELVDFEGARWKVVGIQADRSPKVAVLELELSASQGTEQQVEGHAPHIVRPRPR